MEAEFDDLLGLPLATEVALATPVEEAPKGTAPDTETRAADQPATLETQAVEHNPELAAARQTVQKAHAGVNAARAEFIPEVSAFAEHVYQNGVPLLPENSGIFGLRVDWTLSEFGKRTGQLRERKAQLGEAEENLKHTEERVRIDTEKEIRKLHRTETGLEAARENVVARSEMRRITANQVEVATATPAALKEAEAQLAEAEAQLFEAEMEHAVAEAELVCTLGRVK